MLYYHQLYSTTTTATWLTDMGTKPTNNMKEFLPFIKFSV
ncbi:hypothetical protein HMPREF6745_0201 [Prevotella sp. oral taxon 472 str. F0295]|nr:hypothetical protein HMPREF6745_0201 [Prevotella sp. oral taxon 472 str. F0295]